MANGVEEHGARIKTCEEEIHRLRQWRHDIYTQQYNAMLLRLIKMEEAIAKAGSDTAKRWDIIKPVITWGILGFLGWIAWLLLQLYHAYPRK